MGRWPSRIRTRPLRGLTSVAVIGLLGLGACTVQPGEPDPADLRFAVDVTAARCTNAISPLIYGTNGGASVGTNGFGSLRSGGNRLTAYNWENNASNAGSDWQFQNDGFLSESNTPGAAILPTVDRATSGDAAAIITVPVVDHVAADKNGGGDVRNSGANYLSTRFRQNHAAKGSPLATTPNAGDGHVYQDEFVNWLRTTRPNAELIFSLDNEPDLWSSTHAEIHPAPVTYAELVQRNVTYATAIKRVAPSSLVIGPVNYGFNGFESLQNAPDAGGRNFLDVYLDQMRAADAAAGRRLVDVLDLHWYPEARGGGQRIVGGDNSAAVAEARVQAPRSLYDPGYVEDSWITNDYGYGAINLIPRTRSRIAARNPGMGLGFTEWNFGGGNHISGALATADVLGAFGSQGVRLANLWEMSADERFTYAAFRAFRNYDGAGGRFGDRSCPATTSDLATATVYASTFAGAPQRSVIVAVNKSTSSKRAAISLTSAGSPYTRAKVFTITAGGGADVVARPDITTVATNAFNHTMPAQSVSVIVPGR